MQSKEETMQTWQDVVLLDSELWTDVKLPVHINDVEFVGLLRKIGDFIEVLDCTSCTQLTQDSFVTMSRQPVVVLPRLRRLLVPTDLTLADAVFEALASAGCLPQVQRIDNIQSGTAAVCNPLRCQAYFKNSGLTFLNDSPMSSHGRVRHLLVPDSVEVKQRRQRWDADLAKAAISCPTITTYRCCRGVGYVDDKAIERISVLFPKLRSIHLQLCSVTDDGIAKFFAHKSSSGLTSLTLDRPGEITDKTLKTIADNCCSLSHLTLCRCPAITAPGLCFLLSRCHNLTDLYLSGVTCVDDVILTTLSDSCRHLTSLQVLDASLVTSRGLADVLGRSNGRCGELETLTLHGCDSFDDLSAETIAQHSRHLKHLSIGIGSSRRITPNAVVNLVMRTPSLTSFYFEGNDQFKVDNLPQFAEMTYILLSNDVTCRSSHISSLVLGKVGAKFVNLLIVLCSELTSLDLRNVQIGDDWSDVLTHVVTDCTRLKTLDVTDVVSDAINDEFLTCLCEHALHLTHLALTVGSHVTRDVIEALIRTLPSLASLSIARPVMTSSNGGVVNDELDENCLTKFARQCHGNRCYCSVSKQSPDSKMRYFDLVFTPLKFVTAGKLL